MHKRLTNERGLAIIVVLAILFMLGIIGVAAIRNSSTDMDISRAMTDRTKSFYAADGGLELALATMMNNATVVSSDSLLTLVNADTVLGTGSFSISMTNTYPIRTVTSIGTDRDGESAVAIDVRHRRNPINPWNNAIFAGVGQAGMGIYGNVDIHGSVHILGDGEPFTDENSNGTWDDEDVFVDLNGDGVWQPGEALTTDHDGDGEWDPAEPFVDETGNGLYDQTLTATDMSFDIDGAAAVHNNYSGMQPIISSRVPPLGTIEFNGEMVQTLDAEVRVKHGMVNLSGSAQIGAVDVLGGTPAIKETVDGMFVNDGYGGNQGTSSIYSDNGTTEGYDLPEFAVPFPSLNEPHDGYPDYRGYLAANALIIPGDLELIPGVSYTSPLSTKGSLTVDASGNVRISGIVIVTGDVRISAGSGLTRNDPFIYDGVGTLVSGGNMYINTHIYSRDEFPTDDAMGFISYHDMEIGTGPGASWLALTGAFYAQQTITNQKQNQLAGAMVTNYFHIENVPSIYQVPSLVDHLPPGMPGGNWYTAYTWKPLASTWHEVYPVY